MTYPYIYNSKEELLRLSDLASQEDYDIYISTPFGQLDAKSVLALFTMMGKEVNLVAPDHSNGEAFVKFIEKLQAE